MNCKGFSLPELLIVIGTSVIISGGIITAIYAFSHGSTTITTIQDINAKLDLFSETFRKDLLLTSRTDPVSPSGGPPHIEFPSGGFPASEVTLQVITLDSNGRAYDPTTEKANWGSGRKGGIGEYIRYRVDTNGYLVREILSSDKTTVKERRQFLPNAALEIYGLKKNGISLESFEPYIVYARVYTNAFGATFSRSIQVYLRNDQ